MQARRGEDIESESGMWPGYDPALQGKTGISHRFGPPGKKPVIEVTYMYQ